MKINLRRNKPNDVNITNKFEIFTSFFNYDGRHSEQRNIEVKLVHVRVNISKKLIIIIYENEYFVSKTGGN